MATHRPTLCSSACMLLLALLMTLTVACGGKGEKPRLTPLLDQARSLNSELRTDWQATQTQMTTTLTTVEALPKLDVDPEALDVGLLRQALTECFQSPLQLGASSATGAGAVDGKPAQGVVTPEVICAGESLTALKDLARRYDEEVAKFIDLKIAQVASLKVNLKGELPEKATAIAEQFANARIQVDQLRSSAEDLKRRAEEGELSDEEQLRFKDDYKALQTELNTVEELLNSIEQESLNLKDTVRASVEQVNKSLATFGQ